MKKDECRVRIRALVGADAHEKLLANGLEMEPKKGTEAEPDYWPVVKLFFPVGGATWLLTEIDPQDERLAFGLADLGMGFPELGSIWIPELLELSVNVPLCTEDETEIGQVAVKVEKDFYFTAKKPLSLYAREARAAGSLSAVA